MLANSATWPYILRHIVSVAYATKKIESATGRGRLPPKRPPAASLSRRRKAHVVAFSPLPRVVHPASLSRVAAQSLNLRTIMVSR